MRYLASLLLVTVLTATPPSASASSACQARDTQAPGLGLIEEAFNYLAGPRAMFVEPLIPGDLLGPAAVAAQQELAAQVPAAESVETPPIDEWTTFADAYCSVWEVAGADVTSRPVAYAAIRAMTTAANEGHTRFLTPEMYTEYQSWSTGDSRYEGIGTRLRSDPLGVQYVFPGGPADQAGLLFGDQILAIDGQPAMDMQAADAVQFIRGEAGTTVRLTILRSGEESPFDVAILRAAIRVPLTEARRIDDIAYLHIQSFPGAGLFEEVAEALTVFEAQGLEGLVLDLRSNTGGRLDVGTTVAGLFLPEGTPIYRQTTRRGGQTTKTVSTGAMWLKPVSVLVDDGTASMAELLASALQEQGVATVVGTTTAGSVAGSILIPLSDGSALQVTTLRLDSGLGQVLNNIGVRPDIEVEVTLEDARAGHDRALDVALSELRSMLRLRVLVEAWPLAA